MTKPFACICLSLLLGAGLAACNGVTSMNPPAAAPVSGFVTDVTAFEAFIATRPSAAQFRAAYPDVQLVMPGDITTKEFRMNNSRYFAQFDADGRITGGKFM